MTLHARWTRDLEDAAIDLREFGGLSYRSIAYVLSAYHEFDVTAEQVRFRLRRLGAYVSPAKQEHGRNVNRMRAA